MVSLLSDFLFHVYCSMGFFFSDLPFFWLVFCSESLEQLDEYKKGNKNFVFLVLLPFSQIYFVLYYFCFSWIFFVKSTYFCSFFFQISFSLLTKCVGLKCVFSDFFTHLTSKVTTSIFCRSFHIFSDLFFSIIFLFYGYFFLRSTYFFSIFLLDKCFLLRCSLLCFIYLFHWSFVLRFTLLFVFSFFYICNYLFWLYFSSGWLILLLDFLFVVYYSIDFFGLIDCILFDQLIVYCFVLWPNY